VVHRGKASRSIQVRAWLNDLRDFQRAIRRLTAITTFPNNYDRFMSDLLDLSFVSVQIPPAGIFGPDNFVISPLKLTLIKDDLRLLLIVSSRMCGAAQQY